MPRGTLLSTLRSMLRGEIGQTLNTSVATQGDATLNMVLANMELWLGAKYDWPFLVDKWNAGVAAQQRYVDFPTVNVRGVNGTVNTERPLRFSVFFNNAYQDVDYGISVEEYNSRNPDNNEFLDPIQRWQYDTNIDESTTPNQFEVWPVPAGPQTLRIDGQRQLLPLAADSDKADLDDLLIVYMSAASILARLQESDASIMAGRAEARLRELRATYPSRGEKLVLGKNLLHTPGLRRIVPMVIVK